MEGRVKPDMINRPPHYVATAIEPIDVIEEWGLGFHLGQVIKYIARHGRKGDALMDLRKAKFYLDRAIMRLEDKPAKVPITKGWKPPARIPKSRKQEKP